MSAGVFVAGNFQIKQAARFYKIGFRSLGLREAEVLLHFS
jgi:hypothetical protein